jgi:competence protein ComEC
MEDGFVEKLRTVGLSHIVVASGFHLDIFVNLARRLFGKKSRILALVLSMLLITAYVLLVGFGASLLRAAIMASFSLLSWYFGRRLHPFRAAVYAAFIMLLINPSYLTNIAWLLSFSSYLGIVVFEPIIKRFLYGTQKPPAISESILVTVSAQLACLPISLYFFGGISVLGVIAKLLISPSIAVVIFTTLFSGILPLGALASMFVSIAKIVLGLHVAIINYLSRWQWGYLSFEPNNPGVLLLYFPILLIALIMARREGFSFQPRPLLEKCPKNGKIYAC